MNGEYKQARLPSLGGIAKQAVLPFQILESLDIPCGYERSFKMCHRQLLANRYLLGVSRRNATPQIMGEICRQLGMPVSLLERFEENLADANLVFFGFEDDGQDGNYRVYLEYWDKICAELSLHPTDRQTRLMFLGYKWSAARPANQTITRYECHPLLSTSEILEQIDHVYAPGKQVGSQGFVRKIVQRAAAKSSDRSFLYLEATEENHVRASFDLNIYKAGLRVEDMNDLLLELRLHYEIGRLEFAKLLELVGSKLLGHISGGTNRQGEDFLTVYYEN